MVFQKVTMETFAMFIRGQVGRFVVDRTGLSGTFDLSIDWQIQDIPPGVNVSAPDPAGAPSILTALQEQLGLKLEPQTGPIDVLVIDHVEEPSAN